MKPIYYLSLLLAGMLSFSSCNKEPIPGTFVTLSVINKSGMSVEGKAVYVFREDNVSTKNMAAPMMLKYSDAQGRVQFNLESANLFNGDEVGTFSFHAVNEADPSAPVSEASIEKQITLGERTGGTLEIY